jgi:hypothetical protein
MKDSYYFSHDYNCRTDEKIKKLLMKHGMTGYGIYWSIIEDLYNNANALQTDSERIAYELRTDESIVKSVLNDFNLFVFDGNIFKSLSVQKRLEKRNEISTTATKAANKRWEKYRRNTDAMQPHSESNAPAMQRKEKEIKEKKENTIDNSLSNIQSIFISKTDTEWTKQFALKEAEKFFNYYSSNNWMVGKNKMKSIEHTIANWILRVEKPVLKNAPKPFDPSKVIW